MAPSDDEDAGKRDKASVNYRPATGPERCANCRFMLDDGHCRRVKGIVEPDYVSDLYEPKRAMRMRS